jgi:hypothetical protein
MSCFRLTAWIAAGLVLVTAGVLAAPPPALKGWGQAADPDGDCRFEQKNGKLTLRVPGTLHNLVAGSGRLNAPTVLSPVRGEFIAMVKTTGNVNPGPKSSVPEGLPYHGAGLLLWVDRDNYVRLERAGMIRGGEFITYVNCEHFSRGRRAFSQGRALQDKPTHLRLERREEKVFASASHDGVTWSPFPALDIHLPDELKLGVTAVNSSTKPFAAELEGLTVFTRSEVKSR